MNTLNAFLQVGKDNAAGTAMIPPERVGTGAGADAGVPVPKHADGISINPVLANPTAEWKQPALITHLRGNHALVRADWRYIPLRRWQ